MATYESHAFFCLFRYNIEEQKGRGVIFLKTMDYRREPGKPLTPASLVAWLDEHQTMLQRHPLMVLNTILKFVQFEAQEYVRGRLELYDLESRLRITRDGKSLKQGGYGDVDYNFTLLNADLAGAAKKLADTELSASIILEHAKSLHRLVGLCEDFEAPKLSGRNERPQPVLFEQREGVHSTIIRAQLFLKNMKMSQDAVQSLSAVLYNHINKQETNSMKTIAVVTLVLLPATFISAIFSTGIFNFHASEPPSSPRVVSRYGWVYLTVCLSSTSLTLLLWVCWYCWGRVWLEN